MIMENSKDRVFGQISFEFDYSKNIQEGISIILNGDYHEIVQMGHRYYDNFSDQSFYCITNDGELIEADIYEKENQLILRFHSCESGYTVICEKHNQKIFLESVVHLESLFQPFKEDYPVLCSSTKSWSWEIPYWTDNNIGIIVRFHSKIEFTYSDGEQIFDSLECLLNNYYCEPLIYLINEKANTSLKVEDNAECFKPFKEITKELHSIYQASKNPTRFGNL